jgi:aspartyl-tRNA(Asn)/glutamyl-tRNA(Gln) amidotransferase subunit B
LRRTETDPAGLPLEGPQLAELIAIVDEDVVSSSAAKEVLVGVLEGEGTARQVAESRDLVQISDSGALQAAVESVLDANPDAVDSFRRGEQKVVGYLVGQVMRLTSGKADPKQVNQLLRDKLSG